MNKNEYPGKETKSWKEKKNTYNRRKKYESDDSNRV